MKYQFLYLNEHVIAVCLNEKDSVCFNELDSVCCNGRAKENFAGGSVK